MRLIIFGPPGAGKGSIAQHVTEAAGVSHISTGNMLRAAVAAGSPLGQQVKQVLDTGGYVSDGLMIELVQERLAEPDVAGGWLLDGFPRTLPQAEALDAGLAELGQRLDRVLEVTVAADAIVERLTGRRVCLGCGHTYHVLFDPPPASGVCACGGQIVQREDDQPETVHRRLAKYQAETAPLRDYYVAQGLVCRVDNGGALEAAVAQVRECLTGLAAR